MINHLMILLILIKPLCFLTTILFELRINERV